MSEAKILKHDPLSETEAILRQDFYGADGGVDPVRRPVRRVAGPAKPRPTFRTTPTFDTVFRR